MKPAVPFVWEFFRASWRLVPLLLPAVLLAGCSSPTRYQPAPKKTPPAVQLNLPATEPPIETLLHTIIIYRGPGSWKLDAYWDEYVVTVANRGDGLVVVESVTITDFEDAAVSPGKNPWELEAASHAFVQKSASQNLALQVGGGVVALAALGGSTALMVTGTVTAASAGIAAGGLVLIPLVVGGTIYSNAANRQLIEREFQRRRLGLPATLQPGQLVHGSLFFRISPGPKRITVHCRVDEMPRIVVIDLSRFSGMHLDLPLVETARPVVPSRP